MATKDHNTTTLNVCNLQSATISNTHSPSPNTKADTRKAKKAEWNRQYGLRNKMEKEKKKTGRKLGEPSGKRVKVHNPSNYKQGVTDNEATITNTTQGNNNRII
jgi:hypothetical protein